MGTVVRRNTIIIVRGQSGGDLTGIAILDLNALFLENAEPVAFLDVWLERGLKRKAIDGAFDRRDAPPGELSTGVLWQDEKGPGVGLTALRRPEEFRFETNRGFGHFCLVSLIIMRADPSASSFRRLVCKLVCTRVS